MEEIKTNQDGKIVSPLNSPKEVPCLDCKKLFALTFVVPKWDYSKKNNWDYWTEKEEDKGKYKCNPCLLDLYYHRKEEYWKAVTDSKKRRQMSNYIYDKSISS